MATALERFWAKVDKTPECWLWTGPTAGQGRYGMFYVGGGRQNQHREYAHRWSYELLVGPIPDGMEIDHLCRNRLCVNPAHLEPVKHAENHRRRAGIKHGPYNVGETCKHGHPRTPENVGINTYGYRFCRPCARAVSARLHAEKKRSIT